MNNIDELQMRAENADMDIKITYIQEVAELRAKQEILQEKLDELKEINEEDWLELKPALDTYKTDLQMSLKNAFFTLK